MIKNELHDYLITHYERDNTMVDEIIFCPTCGSPIQVDTILNYPLKKKNETKKKNKTFRCYVCNRPFEKSCQKCGKIFLGASYFCEDCRNERKNQFLELEVL